MKAEGKKQRLNFPTNTKENTFYLKVEQEVGFLLLLAPVALCAN
jgi:hypothetical protein